MVICNLLFISLLKAHPCSQKKISYKKPFEIVTTNDEASPPGPPLLPGDPPSLYQPTHGHHTLPRAASNLTDHLPWPWGPSSMALTPSPPRLCL